MYRFGQNLYLNYKNGKKKKQEIIVNFRKEYKKFTAGAIAGVRMAYGMARKKKAGQEVRK